MKKKIKKLKVRKLGVLDDRQMQTIKGGAADATPGAEEISDVITCDSTNEKDKKNKDGGNASIAC